MRNGVTFSLSRDIWFVALLSSKIFYGTWEELTLFERNVMLAIDAWNTSALAIVTTLIF